MLLVYDFSCFVITTYNKCYALNLSVCNNL